MRIPYRTRQAIKRLLITVLVIALVAALLWLGWVLWLGRYVVYTRDGVVIDRNKSSASLTGELALPPQADGGVQIYFNEGDDTISVGVELTHMAGYYIDQKALETDMASIKSQIEALPVGTPVMIELKNSAGNFFYNSAAGQYRQSTINTAQVDELIEFLNKSGMYTIARITSLRDYNYGLNNVLYGIHHSSRLYLWQDKGGCYWLDPTLQGTMSYLTNIANELKVKGFDEVMFSEFRIPEATDMAFSGNRMEALQKAADALVKACGSDTFTVSFAAPQGFVLPEGKCRLYIENVEPMDAAAAAENSGISNTALNLVFVTPLNDTRFDEYGVLRPLSAADAIETQKQNAG